MRKFIKRRCTLDTFGKLVGWLAGWLAGWCDAIVVHGIVQSFGFAALKIRMCIPYTFYINENTQHTQHIRACAFTYLDRYTHTQTRM